MTPDIYLNVAKTLSHSRANGPGVRAVIWVQGCTIGCPGCYNAFTHPHEKRTLVAPETIAKWVSGLEGIEGVSFSGGEPFEQAKAARMVIRKIRQRSPNLTFFSYTGFNLVKLQKSEDENVIGLLDELDMVSAGPYIHSERKSDLLWRGSSNQQLHYLSNAYGKHLEAAWKKTSPVEEFQYDGNIIHFTGFEGRGSNFLKSINHQLLPEHSCCGWLDLAPMKAGCELSEQMPECAGNNIKSDAGEVVPAPMREEAFGSVQPPDSAETYRKAAM